MLGIMLYKNIECEQFDENRWKLFIPEGIRFIKEWNEFKFDLFSGSFIIDKQIPGCGFTEFCLDDDSGNVILCSPRKILLENKQSQHPEDIHYARNGLEVDPNVDTGDKTSKDQESQEAIDPGNAKQVMFMHLDEYCYRRSLKKKPLKIIVTYDSFKHVKEYFELLGIFGHFTIVVDEFQSIFIDSHFKATTELSFFNILKTVKNRVCFVSATPMIDKYLFQLEEFENMPYFRFDWEKLSPGRVVKPTLKVKKIRSVFSEIKGIIQTYLEGKYATLANPETGEIIQSKEAVFYLNSVNDILKVIKNVGLTPDQCNILCSDTPQNRVKLKTKLGTKYQIGTVPMKGEPHKMFTFCTRTVYLGADFYSTNARTFVLSDANIESLSVDISLDLPQILGRQRLRENPWKNHAEFYFKPFGKKAVLDKSDFMKYLNDKIQNTYDKIEAYNNLVSDKNKQTVANSYRDSILVKKYTEDYVSVDNIGGILTPSFNYLIKISEERAFDIQQVDYKDRFTVFSTIKESQGLSLDRMSSFIDQLRDTKAGKISDRLRMLCDSIEFSESDKKIIAQQASEKFDQYYNLVGPDRCRALGYNVTLIKQEVENKKVDPNRIREGFITDFSIGENIIRSEVKTRISNLYQRLGLDKKAKATDLSEYFEIKNSKFKCSDGNWAHSIEIVSLKRGGRV